MIEVKCTSSVLCMVLVCSVVLLYFCTHMLHLSSHSIGLRRESSVGWLLIVTVMFG